MHRNHIRERGLPGWVTAVDDEAQIVTITFFGGVDPKLFDELTRHQRGASSAGRSTKPEDDPNAPKGTIAVARESLMTYDPVNDRKGGNILDIKKDPRRTRQQRRADPGEVRPAAGRLPPAPHRPLLSGHVESHRPAAGRAVLRPRIAKSVFTPSSGDWQSTATDPHTSGRRAELWIRRYSPAVGGLPVAESNSSAWWWNHTWAAASWAANRSPVRAVTAMTIRGDAPFPWALECHDEEHRSDSRALRRRPSLRRRLTDRRAFRRRSPPVRGARPFRRNSTRRWRRPSPNPAKRKRSGGWRNSAAGRRRRAFLPS